MQFSTARSVQFSVAGNIRGQVDFADFVLPWGKRYALVVVLGYSWMLWLQYYERQTMETVVRGLKGAFAFFGGVPAELLFDQMRAVVVGDRRAEGGRLLENREFLRFSAHWGFRIRACRAGRAKTKRKVERPINYVRSSFFYGREFVRRRSERSCTPLAGHGGQRSRSRHVEAASRGPLRARAGSAPAVGGTALSLGRPGRGSAGGAPESGSPGGGVVKAVSRRDRIAEMLAGLKMPGALEALADVLARVDGGAATAAEAIEDLLAAQIALRNSRRLATAMRSSPSAVGQDARDGVAAQFQIVAVRAENAVVWPTRRRDTHSLTNNFLPHSIPRSGARHDLPNRLLDSLDVPRHPTGTVPAPGRPVLPLPMGGLGPEPCHGEPSQPTGPYQLPACFLGRRPGTCRVRRNRRGTDPAFFHRPCTMHDCPGFRLALLPRIR